MIDINTLRLGNLLYFSDSDNNVKNAIATVKGIEDDDMVKFEATNVKDESSETRVSISTNQVSGWGNSDQFDYIPLDSGWLEKFDVQTNEYFKEGNGVYWFTRHNPQVPIQWVHQFQNLFFLLKEKELKIK